MSPSRVYYPPEPPQTAMYSSVEAMKHDGRGAVALRTIDMSCFGSLPRQPVRHRALRGREPDPESVSKPKSCTICLYQFKPRERVRLIPCMHQFHTEVGHAKH